VSGGFHLAAKVAMLTEQTIRVATASLIEVWIDESERRTWFSIEIRN